MRLILLIVVFLTSVFGLKADILLNQTFPSSTLPAGWTNTALQGSDIWLIRNAPLFGSVSGGNYAVFDDQALGAAVIPNEAALTSPIVDCSNRTAIYLKYTHHWFGVEFTHGYVEVSNNGGTTWTTVKDYHKITRGTIAAPQDTVLDISAIAANQASVQVRFRYTDGSQAGRYWYLDDIMIYADPDAGVTALVDPPYLGCGQSYTATETVTIQVTNFGVSSISNIPVTCDVTGAITTTITGTVPGPIASGATVNYTFPTTINMTTNGVYNFYAYTILPSDAYLLNDTLYDSRQQLVVSTYPYAQDFNGTSGGWNATGAAPPLNNGRNFYHGSLPYLNGPQGNGDSWYVETTSSNNGTFIWVESPVFDFSTLTNPQLTFDIKHSLHSSDYFHVEYSLNGGTTWTQLGNGSSPNWYNGTNWWRNSFSAPVDAWTQVQHNLCALAGQSCVKLRIYGRPYYSAPTYSNYHLFAFDNVEIKDGPDVGVIAYIDPVDVGCLFAQTQQVTVEVYNWGCAPVSNVPIQCDITGALTQTLTGTVPGPIPVGGSVSYTFPGTINMTPLGIYNFNTYTQLAGDINPNNDTLATSINVNILKVTTYPYLEDFNSGAGFWTASGQAPPLNNGRNFNLGALPYLNGPQGMGDSWYVETTSSNNGTFIWVESPVFDFTNLTNPTLTFDVKHSLHNSDYFHVEYSLNGGTTWSQLGSGPNPTWYNGTNWWRNSFSAPVDAWTSMEQELCDLSGEPCVKFRIYGRPYYSAPTYSNYHLFAFDNFAISSGEPDDVEPIEIIMSDAGDCNPFSTAEAISVLIQNNTCRPIYNLPVDLQLNGGPIISEVVPGPIPRFGTFIYTFTNTLDLSPAGTHSISVTTNLATDNVPANDTRVQNRYSSSPITTYPYSENFDANNGGWVSRTTINTRYFHNDTLPYLNGPQGNGNSWYVETNASNNGTFIWVESPVFDFSALSNPILSFDIKHSLHSSDYFHVEYSVNGGTTWTQLGNGSTPNWYNGTNWWRNSFSNPVDAWTQVQHNLCALAGQSCVKLRIYGRPYYSAPNYSNYHLFAFDNVEIAEGNDVGVIAYIEPAPTGCNYSTNQQVTVTVFNFGCGAVTNTPIQCDITGALTQTLNGTVPGPIPAGGSVNYTFPTTVNMTPLGTYNFNTYTQDPSDSNNGNDTLATSILVNQVTINTFPYFEDFNSGPASWIATGQSPPLNNGRNFVLGNMTYLNGPQGHGDSWNVETTSSNNGTFIWVESPIFDFTNLTNPKLLMDIKHSLHNSDYFHVEYSINGGTSWTQLGTGADPFWYNNTNWWRNSFANPVDEWTNVEHTLCNLAGQPCVKFRVYGRPYYSAPTYSNYHWFGFDNFHITDTPLDAEVNFVAGCFGSTYQLDVTVVNVDRLCLTSPAINSIDLTYTINGGAPVTQTFTGLNIPFGGSDVIAIPNVTIPNNSSTVKVWCSNPNGVTDQIWENDTAYGYSMNWPNCNDHCSNATQLALGTSTATQTSNGTTNPSQDPNFSACGSITIENTVWYQFTTNASGDSVTIIFDSIVCSPSQNGIQISIDSVGTPCDTSTYTNIFCSATGDTAAIQFGPVLLAPNTTYYIAIDGFAGSDCDFNITITGAVNPPLPVELMFFDASCYQFADAVDLKWVTNTEINNDYFTVERSYDGVNFIAIAQLNGAGNSSAVQTYHFRDFEAQGGMVYYRLKQTDFNGNYEYSAVRVVNCEDKANVGLYPNPVNALLNIDVSASEGDQVQIELFNSIGQQVKQTQFILNNSEESKTMDMQDLAEGIYMVNVKINDELIETQKLIIRR